MKQVVVIMISLLISTNVLAQINPIDRIQNNQQRLIDEEFRRRELDNALRQPTVEKAITKTSENEDMPAGGCINIKKMEITGNDTICTNCIDEASADYIGKCLTLVDIDKMLQDITNYYIKKGYITSRAYMSMPQNRIKDGILEIKIIEGKVSKIEGLKKGESLTAFPSIADKILNIRDVEQGLDQINRLPSNQTTMDIKADEEINDHSKIIISNQPKGRTGVTFFGDNAGSESTGETRFGLRASQDNLLGLNDQIYMTYTKSPSQDHTHRNANSFALGMSMPFGYWTLTNNFSWSNYRTSFVLINGDRFYSYGNSTTNDISLDRLLFRGQSFKISAGGGFTYKTNSNYTRVLDLKIKNEVSSRDLSIIHFDLPTTLYTPIGVFYFKPSYVQGVRAFDTLRDKDYSYSQKAQYKAWKLYAYYTKYFGPVNYTTAFDGQYTKDEMFGSEAFFIGGEYTVRGFKEDSFQGDNGYAWRNDLSANLGNVFNSENVVLQSLTPCLFMDYGYAHSNNKNIKSEILSGAGAKIDINYKFFDASISYAEPLKKPDWMKENHVWYLYAGMSFRF